jgi:hypothetical protein
MAGKTMTVAFALAAGLLAVAVPVAAHDGKVEILHGQPATTAVSMAADEGGTGVTVFRGSSNFVPAKPVTLEPAVFISGEKVKIGNLEPTGNWFLDRSEGRLVVVHCYTRQSMLVGGGRRILCDARQL